MKINANQLNELKFWKKSVQLLLVLMENASIYILERKYYYTECLEHGVIGIRI